MAKSFYGVNVICLSSAVYYVSCVCVRVLSGLAPCFLGAEKERERESERGRQRKKRAGSSRAAARARTWHNPRTHHDLSEADTHAF